MSPRWEPDFEGTHATTPVYDRGNYRVRLGKPRGMAYTRDDGSEVAGVRYPLEMVGQVLSDGSLDDALAGQEVSPVRLYIHSGGALRMTKRVLMAFFGYDRSPDAEREFNSDVIGALDFGIEPPEDEGDAASIGDGWLSCSGNEVDVVLDQEEYEGELQQTHKAWTPIGG